MEVEWKAIGKFAAWDILASGDMRRIVDGKGHIITEYFMKL